MDLKINGKQFLVTGASSGFGRAIASRLDQEGARVLAVARRREKLLELQAEHAGVEILPLDVTLPESPGRLLQAIGDRPLEGVVINAGGPPAKAFLETNLEDWDQAYHQVLRWKVDLTLTLLPLFEKSAYGRYLYIESMSVKQPSPNLVLSSALRLAVTGFVKTFANEIGHKGITANIMGPGFHLTPALDRVIRKRAEISNTSMDEALQNMVREVPVPRTGDVDDFASLAAWLLSPYSAYITGQTISVDGGSVMGTWG